MQVYGEAWKSVPDPFLSIPIDPHCMMLDAATALILMLPLTLDVFTALEWDTTYYYLVRFYRNHTGMENNWAGRSRPLLV